MGAHPRSRGENFTSGSRTERPTGSSPLTRGKLQGAGEAALDGGLIPAHAGKTSKRSLRSPISRAHPRSRGENTCRGLTLGAICGSSPLTRGKPARLDAEIARLRLIPAHAGKTRVLRTSRLSRWAHPRSRGENDLLARLDMNELGSSPLTRGKRRGVEPPEAHERLIPAHAGKTH